MTTATPVQFEDHCRECVRELRGAILELYAQVGADPDKPQDVSRLLGLNKNLTWKISRVLLAEEVFEALPLLPGGAGLDLVLEATAKAGASPRSLDRARVAIASIESMVNLHGGDRATMELMLDSMGVGGLEKSRKLAFRGNSGLWGVMAKVRVSAQVLAPNAQNPDMLDMVLVAGLQNVRRFRPIQRWPIFRLERYDYEGEVTRFSVEDAPGAPWGMMPSFSRGPLPKVHVREEGNGLIYEVGDGPVGKTGEFSCYFGFGFRADVPRYATERDESAWLAASVAMPVETLLLDMFVHKDLPEAMDPETSVYGGAWVGAPGFPDSARLPIHEHAVHLGRGADLSTPLDDQYPGVMARVFDRTGWRPEDFHCLRLVIEYPPMPSRAVMRYRLPTKG